MTEYDLSVARLEEMVRVAPALDKAGIGHACDAGLLAAMATELLALRTLTAAHGEAVALYGPFGWLNGHRGLSEDSWSLEMDPLENNEEYFAIPLFAKVDPFVEVGKTIPPTLSPDSLPLGVKGLLDRAAAEGYRVCAETRHVTLGDKVSAAISALKPIDPERISEAKLRAAICDALLTAFPMADKIADNYAAVAARVAALNGAV